MREIKFRAYHKKEERFYYFDLETCTKTIYVGYYHPITSEKDCELDDPNLYSEKQLYTGLKDKNGKEIYGGDIVKTDEAGWVAQVIYSRDDFMCIGLDEKGFSAMCNWEEFEVIGNIYENPNLLDQRGKE